MTAPGLAAANLGYAHRHLLGIEGLSADEISFLLDLSENYVELSRRGNKKTALLRGLTIINLFFENSTRTRTSFELAGKRLGADVINMSVAWSSIKKGETLIDTAMTLNAMHPDVLVVRHPDSGAVKLLSEKVTCAVINAGDGSHEHPTQALLDGLTIRRRTGRLEASSSPSAATSCTPVWPAPTFNCWASWARACASSPRRRCCRPRSSASASRSSST